MQRINTANGLWSDGDPSQGIKGSRITAAWLNSIQEEIAGVIEGAGTQLVAANSAQLLAAINALATARAAAVNAAATTVTVGDQLTSNPVAKYTLTIKGGVLVAIQQ